MPIQLVRVDHRLVHGQVTMGWSRTVGAEVLLVVNDRAAGDPFEANLMQLAVPSEMRLELWTLERALAAAAGDAWPQERTLLLVANPLDLLRLVEAGLALEEVNIGGVRSPGAERKLTKEVFATDEEIAAWRAMDERGMRLSVQWLPAQRRKLLNDVLAKA